MESPETIGRRLREFANLVPSIGSFQVQQYPVSAMRDRRNVRAHDWARLAGIYCFFRAGKLEYIGRALARTGLGRRVVDQATSVGDPKWDDVILDEATVVMVVALDEADAFWAASLELFLIEACGAGLINKRRC